MANPSPTVFKIEAGIAARAGRWGDVERLAQSGQGHDRVTDNALRLFLAEALSALGRHDDALHVVRLLDPDELGYYFRFAELVHAAIDLGRGEPRATVERLTGLVDKIECDGRRLALGMNVASLLAVAAHDLGQDETAAVLFGHAAAERTRLAIVLRPSDQALAADRISGCRSALGAERVEELAALGADTEWPDLPKVEL